MDPFNFKVVVVGDGGVGKTTFLKRHRTGEFERKYLPTIGVEVHSLKFDTITNLNMININNGNIINSSVDKNSVIYNIWDCAGQEKFGGLRDGYYINTNAAIIMADSTSRTSIKNIPFWIESLHKVTNLKNIPVCVVFTKWDLEQDRKAEIIDKTIKVINSSNLQNFNINTVSSKNNIDLFQPFLNISRQLIDPDIEFIQPSEIGIPVILDTNPLPEIEEYEEDEYDYEDLTDPGLLYKQSDDLCTKIDKILLTSDDLYEDKVTRKQIGTEILKLFEFNSKL